MDADQFKREFGTRKKRKPKYKAIRVPNCRICGFSHDSKAEASRCAHWSLMKGLGQILHYDIHPVVTVEGIKMTLDFMIHYEHGRIMLEDVKGKPTRDFMTKLKLFDRVHPLAPMSVVQNVGSGKMVVWKQINPNLQPQRNPVSRDQRFPE